MFFAEIEGLEKKKEKKNQGSFSTSKQGQVSAALKSKRSTCGILEKF